ITIFFGFFALLFTQEIERLVCILCAERFRGLLRDVARTGTSGQDQRECDAESDHDHAPENRPDNQPGMRLLAAGGSGRLAVLRITVRLLTIHRLLWLLPVELPGCTLLLWIRRTTLLRVRLLSIR